jgi:hypothetical protein
VDEAVARLLDYRQIEDDVDSKIGTRGHAGMTISGQFQPSEILAHAMQRWLFRMVHSQRPLQEKMTLFRHNPFATGASKVTGTFGSIAATTTTALSSEVLRGLEHLPARHGRVDRD